MHKKLAQKCVICWTLIAVMILSCLFINSIDAHAEGENAIVTLTNFTPPTQIDLSQDLEVINITSSDYSIEGSGTVKEVNCGWAYETTSDDEHSLYLDGVYVRYDSTPQAGKKYYFCFEVSFKKKSCPESVKLVVQGKEKNMIQPDEEDPIFDCLIEAGNLDNEGRIIAPGGDDPSPEHEDDQDKDDQDKDDQDKDDQDKDKADQEDEQDKDKADQEGEGDQDKADQDKADQDKADSEAKEDHTEAEPEPQKDPIEIQRELEDSIAIQTVTIDTTMYGENETELVPTNSYNLSKFMTTQGIIKGIKTAAEGSKNQDTTNIYTGMALCFNKEILNSIADCNKDITYRFKHKGHLYEMVIPSELNIEEVLEDNGYAGALYVGQKLGTLKILQ